MFRSVSQMHRPVSYTHLPLNEEGIQMAEQAKEKYKDVNFDICYCSPLVRAKQTAEIVLEGRNIPIVYDDRLDVYKRQEWKYYSYG